MKLLIFHKLFKEVFYMVIRDFEVNQWLWHTALLKLDRMNWQKYWISAVSNWDIKLYSLNLFRTYKIYLFFLPKMSENGTKGDNGGKMCIHRCFDNEPWFTLVRNSRYLRFSPTLENVADKYVCAYIPTINLFGASATSSLSQQRLKKNSRIWPQQRTNKLCIFKIWVIIFKICNDCWENTKGFFFYDLYYCQGLD